MTLSDMRTEVRRLLNETDTAQTHFPDSALNSWLNQGYRDMAAWLAWPKIESTAESVTDQNNYTLPTNFMVMLEVFFDTLGTAEHKLEPTDQVSLPGIYGTNWRDEDVGGTPRYYYFPDTNVLGIYPKPNADNNARTIRIFYVATPTAMSADSDSPDLPEVYHDLMALFAAHMAHLQLRNNDISRDLYGRYLDRRDRNRMNLTKLGQEQVSWKWHSV